MFILELTLWLKSVCQELKQEQRQKKTQNSTNKANEETSDDRDTQLCRSLSESHPHLFLPSSSLIGGSDSRQLGSGPRDPPEAFHRAAGGGYSTAGGAAS